MQPSDFDPSLNILYRYRQPLDFVFSPKSVAVIGATDKPGSVGRTLLWNLLKSPFGGIIYPVNPNRRSVLGIKAYANVMQIAEDIDLAVIALPAKLVSQAVVDCTAKRIPAAIIVSAGFRETGKEGEKLEEEILREARKGNMRIIGPNCLGIMNPISGINATFASDMAIKGTIAFISQSGALCTAVLDWSLREQVGFSAFVSIGSMLDVGFGDLINYFGNDPNTESILIYMENIGNTRAFLSAAREVAITKPIILIKAGKSEASAKAASSHTGALVCSDEVFDVALKRVGILRVNEISDLFGMAEIFSKQPKPKSPNLAIITNAGGPGVIATDALIQYGAGLATLEATTIEKLNEFLPSAWSRNNPIDILGDADPERYSKAIKIVVEDKNVSGILVILTPQYMTDPTATAIVLRQFSKISDKPILASWMGGNSVKEANEILVNAGIPVFEYPDSACKAFAYMWTYTSNLKSLYETPIGEEAFNINEKLIYEIINEAREEKRELLTEYESKKILESYGIDVVPTFVANSPKEALLLADKLGYPLVAKINSRTITHKSDVGGVKLNLKNKEEVAQAFEEIKQAVSEKDFLGITLQPMEMGGSVELILGSYKDPYFGPILLFGAGGEMVEIFKDRSLALPPLTSTLAKKMMEETKIFKALTGFRGKRSVNIAYLSKLLVRFSNFISDYPIIKECDINPLLVGKDKIVALDARIVLESKDSGIIPAICPYPAHYIKKVKLKNELMVTIRPIRPEDEPFIVQFYKEISEDSLRQRYLDAFKYAELISREQLIRTCFNDFDREITLVVELGKEILALGKFTKINGDANSSFAMIVKDKWQNFGIGSLLLLHIIEIAKNEKMKSISAYMLPENEKMRKVCEKFGFKFSAEDKFLLAILYPS